MKNLKHKTSKKFDIIKHISAVLAFSVIFSQIAVQAKTSFINPEDEMLNFGIIAEKVDTARTVTFAEYSTMLMRAIGLDDMTKSAENEKWYERSMKSASGIGLYNTFENEVEAEKPIKSEYALSMTASALGYNHIVEKTFDALYAEAMRLGLSVGISAKQGETLTREDAYIILHNALGTNLCVMDGRGYSISKDTLEDRLMNMKDSEYMIGIVEADEMSSISGDCTDEGKVRIGGELFETGDIDVSGYIGSYVRFFVQEDRRGAKTIKWMEPHKDNEIIFFDEDSDISIENNRLYYYEDNNKRKNIKLSDGMITIYNNRPTARILKDIISASCHMKLTDNNGDGEYDVADITKIESCVVKNIYPNQEQIILEYATDGKSRLNIKDYEICEYYDAGGNKIKIADINQGDALSVVVDENREYMQIYKTEQPFVGIARSKTDNSAEVTIDSEIYKYICDSASIIEGEKCTFYKDLWGRIFYSRDEFDDYVYIRQVYEGEKPDSVYINTFEGEKGFNTYKLSDKVKIDGKRNKKVEDILNSLNAGTLATITFNSSEEVQSIKTATTYASKGLRTYCENDFGFVDYDNKILQPFACDMNRTKVFFVPSTNEKSDYFNIFTLDDDEDYVVTGYDYDKNINRVRAAVVEINPEQPLQSGFSKSSEFMAVNEIYTTITDDDEATYGVGGICGGEEITLVASQRQNVFNELSTVNKGDVIQFIRNMNGEIGLVRKVMDFSELGEYYYDDSDYKSIELYAPASEVNKDVMTNIKKYLVNEIKCSVDGLDISSCVSASETGVPNTDNKGFDNYFLYNDREYEKGNIDSIIDSYGANGSDLYIWSNGDDVKFITIINK